MDPKNSFISLSFAGSLALPCRHGRCLEEEISTGGLSHKCDKLPQGLSVPTLQLDAASSAHSGVEACQGVEEKPHFQPACSFRVRVVDIVGRGSTVRPKRQAMRSWLCAGLPPMAGRGSERRRGAPRRTCTSWYKIGIMTPKTGRARGRPSADSAETLQKIIGRVALGETLRQVCSEPGMPTARSFRLAVLQDADLREQWEVAKAERAHSLFEEAIDLARKLRDTTWAKDQTNEVTAGRVAIEALREAAARMSPREYGQRPASQVVVPVQINTTLDLSSGPARATNARNTYQVEVQLPAPSEEPLPNPLTALPDELK